MTITTDQTLSPTGLGVSRYLLLGDKDYVSPDGRIARPLYATRTGSFLMIDPETATWIEQRTPAPTSKRDLNALRKAKVLIEASEDELTSVIDKFKEFSADRTHRRFTLMPTSFCNMGCDYCGQEHYKSRATTETMNLMRDRVLHAIEDPDVNSVVVTWFGGEPLLALRHMREISAYLTDAADRNGTSYFSNIATNGALLTKRTLTALYDECRIRGIDITIDGPPEIHDARRILKSGGVSFHRTVQILRHIVDSSHFTDLRVNVRLNIDEGNQDHIDRLMDILKEAGVTGPRIRLQFMPVHSWGNDISAVELGKSHFAKRQAAWVRRALKMGFQSEVMPATARKGTCLATTENAEILDSEARMYACSEHPLVPGERDTKVIASLSSLSHSAPRPKGQFSGWYDDVVTGRQSCSGCPVLPVCGGACPKLWNEGHIPCPSIKYNWEEMLDILAQQYGWQRA